MNHNSMSENMQHKLREVAVTQRGTHPALQILLEEHSRGVLVVPNKAVDELQ